MRPFELVDLGHGARDARPGAHRQVDLTRRERREGFQSGLKPAAILPACHLRGERRGVERCNEDVARRDAHEGNNVERALAHHSEKPAAHQRVHAGILVGGLAEIARLLPFSLFNGDVLYLAAFSAMDLRHLAGDGAREAQTLVFLGVKQRVAGRHHVAGLDRGLPGITREIIGRDAEQDTPVVDGRPV